MEDSQQYRVEGNAFKHEDTTHVMKIRFLAGNKFDIYPVEGHTYTAKIGTSGGEFLGTYPASTQGARFIVKSSDLKGLDVGDYRLEIWEKFTDSNGDIQTRIFPSPKAFVSFTINKNVEDSVWDLVRDVSFQDLVNTAVVAAGQNLVVTGTETLPAGSQANVVQTFKDGKNELTFKLPQGATGPMAALHLGGITQGEPGTQPDAKLVKGDDGYTLSFVIPRAKDGDKGQKGDDGHTPVRGTDYWTDADQKAIKDDMKTTISQLGSFHDFGTIASGVDGNDCTETGIYSVGSNAALKNIPISFGILMVIAPTHGTTYVMQLCVSVANNGVLYMRTKNGSFGWSEWNKFSKDS